MKLTVNGEKTSTKSTTLKELLADYEIDVEEGGVAVAVNDALVARQKIDDYQLQESDNIEIIRATQGG